jgi:hypothetical protein
MTRRELTWLALALMVSSAVLYTVHYLIFGDARHIALYLIGDLAFLPLQVLLVTVLLDRILSAQEKRSRQHKMNMVIGTFFSAVGGELIRRLTAMVEDQTALRQRLDLNMKSTEVDIAAARQWVGQAKFGLRPTPEQLQCLKEAVTAERPFLLGLLENPTLLEHDAFTDLLWATFHVAEELGARPSLDNLPTPDMRHLAGDVERAYGHLLGQWLGYMLHLRRDYPYLFSFAARTNPLRLQARAELTE